MQIKTDLLISIIVVHVIFFSFACLVPEIFCGLSLNIWSLQTWSRLKLQKNNIASPIFASRAIWHPCFHYKPVSVFNATFWRLVTCTAEPGFTCLCTCVTKDVNLRQLAWLTISGSCQPSQRETNLASKTHPTCRLRDTKQWMAAYTLAQGRTSCRKPNEPLAFM